MPLSSSLLVELGYVSRVFKSCLAKRGVVQGFVRARRNTENVGHLLLLVL